MIKNTHLFISRLFVVVTGILAIVAIGHTLELYLPAIEEWIDSLGRLAPLGYIALFVATTPFFVSVDLLCFAAGILFPLFFGEVYMAIATYLAAAFIFLLSRALLKSRLSSFIANHNKLAMLESALSSRKFKLMLLLRLTPLPFALLSYAFAATEVRFMPYLAATSGILVYNMTLVYIGFTTKHLAGLVSGTSGQNPVSYPLLMIGLVLTLTILIYVAKMAASSVKEWQDRNNDG